MEEASFGVLAIHDGRDPSFLGVLAIVALVAGLLFRTLLGRLPIPFTVLCLAFGIFLGELVNWTDTGLGALHDSILNWIALQPNTVLVLFLPPLIFESASTIDIHVFQKALPQILLLAIPGVLINVFLIAVVAQYVFPYDWSFTQAMTIGSMLSATDPVAVVALLRDLGAPSSLSTIIEGESLLNDGVAFVLFLFFVESLEGSGGGIGDFLGEFFYASCIGTLVGAVLGTIATFCSAAMFDDSIAQVILTFIGAFGVFFIAEGILEASGVLSIVAFGLCYSSFRHGGMSVRANEALETVWETLAFAANTVIFVYSGFLIVFFVHKNEGSGDPENPNAEIGWREWGLLVLLTGYKMNWKWATIMSWGGLRGAVGLALGLILITNEDISQRFSTRAMFFMSGIVALTLLINAVLTGPLVRNLGVNRQSKAATFFYLKAVELIQVHVEETITMLQRSTKYRGADWDRVRAQIPTLSECLKRPSETQTGQKMTKQLSMTSRSSIADLEDTAVDIEVSSMPPYTEAPDTDCLIEDGRIRFLNLVKSSYHQDFRNGAVTSKSYITLLLDSATAAQEVAEGPLSDWDSLSYHCSVPKWYNAIKFRQIRHFFVVRRISLAYQVASAFILAHESVVPIFKTFVTNPEIVDKIVDESAAEVIKAQKTLNETETQFPDLTRTIKTRQVSEQVMNHLVGFAEELLEHGEIEEKELKSIEEGVHKSKIYLWLSHFRNTEKQDKKDVFRNAELFIGTPIEQVDAFWEASSERFFKPDEIVQGVEKKPLGIYVIVHGSVEVECGGRTLRLSYGDAINTLSVVCDQIHALTYKATSDVRSYFIPLKKILCSLQEHQNEVFERNIYFRAGVEAALVTPRSESQVLTANPWNVGHIMQKAQVVRAPNKRAVPAAGGVGLLFSGQLYRCGEVTLLEPLTPIKLFACDTQNWFDHEAVYLWIPPQVSWMFDSVTKVSAPSTRRIGTMLDRASSKQARDSGRHSPLRMRI